MYIVYGKNLDTETDKCVALLKESKKSFDFVIVCGDVAKLLYIVNTLKKKRLPQVVLDGKVIGGAALLKTHLRILKEEDARSR